MSSTTTASGTASDTRTWTIDPVHSQVELGVRHMMISTVKGYFTELEGAIQLDPDDLANSGLDVSIPAASIDTRNEDRDAHLRSGDFLDAERFPTIRYSASEVEPADDGEGFLVHGDLTIRDVTRPVTLEAEEQGRGVDPWGNDRVAYRAGGKISREQFGLTWNQALETGGVLVGDEIDVQIEVQAVASSEEEEE